MKTSKPEWETFRHFCAMQYYVLTCIRNRTTPVRWGCLREDLRDHYLEQADQTVAAWNADEEDARQRREKIPLPKL
jgi:hypothetical protein